MNLLIDIGNTKTKAAIANDNQLLHQEYLSDMAMIDNYFKNFSISKCIISAVSEIPDQLVKTLRKNHTAPLVLTTETKLPIINCYSTPHTLGVDRIALASGAHFLYPDKNKLVIDCGTAITLDIINDKGEFLGGNISPGIDLRLNALHYFTKKLPLIEKKRDFTFSGNSTETAILNGVMNGIVFEIKGYMDEFNEKYNHTIVILTGGDAFFFDKRVKKTIFVHSNILFTGLNCILNYNV